jgi:hypothetical protein
LLLPVYLFLLLDALLIQLLLPFLLGMLLPAQKKFARQEVTDQSPWHQAGSLRTSLLLRDDAAQPQSGLTPHK